MSGVPNGLLAVRHFVIPTSVLHMTIDFLREVGASGAEGFVLWGGKPDGAMQFRYTRAIIPEQHALKTEGGLLVVVDGDALFKVNKDLYKQGETLGAQVHSHPTSAYHSDTDDFYPLVTLLGALSVVVPDFARHAPRDLKVWAWYRLEGYGRWAPIPKDIRITFE
jgi:hypothetical protein